MAIAAVCRLQRQFIIFTYIQKDWHYGITVINLKKHHRTKLERWAINNGQGL